jgi:hypothetical protein
MYTYFFYTCVIILFTAELLSKKLDAPKHK